MLKKQKHKSFNYQSRYSKDVLVDKEAENDLNPGVSNKWQKNRRNVKQKKTSSKLLVLVVLLGIIVAILYYLETKIR